MSVGGFQTDQYQLLDFGAGRKLERFGAWIIDRPSPPAEHVSKLAPELWQTANLRFSRKDGLQGKWKLLKTDQQIDFGKNGEQFKSWSIGYHHHFRLQLNLSPVGHLGVFAEQADNWHWIMQQVQRLQQGHQEPVKVLNLFAYTGGSTLAAAAAGAHVTHIDSAENIVNRARGNAALSGYQGVILYPPTSCHGPKNPVWKIGKHLLPLLELCGALTRKKRGFVLLTNHSPDFSTADLEASFADAIFGSCGAGAHASRMTLTAQTGHRLDAGCVVRFP